MIKIAFNIQMVIYFYCYFHIIYSIPQNWSYHPINYYLHPLIYRHLLIKDN